MTLAFIVTRRAGLFNRFCFSLEPVAALEACSRAIANECVTHLCKGVSLSASTFMVFGLFEDRRQEARLLRARDAQVG